MRTHGTYLILAAGILLALSGQPARAEIDIQPSVFDQRLADLQADYSVANIRDGYFQLEDESGSDAVNSPRRKSPAKAFFLSLALPGAGQFYTGGSILKPLGFLAVEATAWGLYFKYHGDGEDLTDEFEAFNRQHWSEDRYTTYLEIAYGESDDDNIPDQEISHHLPDDFTQQFFEMTGKYDQFSWGWDDANLNGNILTDTSGYHPPKLDDPANIPTSANRLRYETMRNNANNKFDNATNMIIVSMANRLISAFEAFLSAKKHNRSVTPTEFGRVNVQAKLKSIYSFADTPTVKVSVRF